MYVYEGLLFPARACVRSMKARKHVENGVVAAMIYWKFAECGMKECN
jgi:hypothetical protein